MATEVAFSTIAPRASSSPRSGVPWQEAIAIASAVAARLRCAIRSIDGRDPKPPATQIRDDRVGLVVAVPRRAHAPGPVDHRLVQIRRRNRHRFRQRRGHRPRDDTGPGRDLGGSSLLVGRPAGAPGRGPTARNAWAPASPRIRRAPIRRRFAPSPVSSSAKAVAGHRRRRYSAAALPPKRASSSALCCSRIFVLGCTNPAPITVSPGSTVTNRQMRWA